MSLTGKAILIYKNWVSVLSKKLLSTEVNRSYIKSRKISLKSGTNKKSHHK